jgi:NAD(P)-dependent dehydrogenase (short-subunit alcohol dehydrogenase family)
MSKLKRLTPSQKPKDFLLGGKIMSLANLFDLSGHVAVVTGGNGGIGRSIALGLAQAGAAIAVLARNEEKNQRVLGELKALGRPALAVRVDVTVRGAIAAGPGTGRADAGASEFGQQRRDRRRRGRSRTDS